jgi:ACS family tartrate transporter-like MFS transporter
MRKVIWRLVPFTMGLYVINIMDRVNIGYAALRMNKDLGIAPAAFGALAAAFFIGYFFFEVPSNMILERVGSRKWIARIMVSWGIATGLVFFAQAYWQIYVLRLILGIMEAGFFPGIIFYFTLWFPTKERALVTSLFFVGANIGFMIGSPLATAIMKYVSWLGMSGWRWVFMIEGLLAIVMGIITWFYLTDKPKDAKWLTQEEKDWLVNKLESEREMNKVQDISVSKSFASIRVWHLAAIYFFFQIGSQAMQFWMPQIVKGFSATFGIMVVGYILIIPPFVASIFMIIWGRHSDKSGERKYHSVFAILLCLVGALLAALSKNLIVRITGMVFIQAGAGAFYGPFWSLPAVYLTGIGAAVGIAIVNSCSSAAGFVGNMAVGRITGALGSNAALVFLAASFALAILLILIMRMRDVALEADTKKQV